MSVEIFQWRELLQNNLISLQKIPYGLRSKDVCIEALKRDEKALRYVPLVFQDHSLFSIAVKFHGYSLQYIPKKYRTKEICLLAVQNQGKALEYVPKDNRDIDVCISAVEQNGSSLCFVPKELRTLELCSLAIRNNGKAFKYVPKKKRTYDMCRLAIQNLKSSEMNLLLNAIPAKFHSTDLYLYILKHSFKRNIVLLTIEKLLSFIPIKPDYLNGFGFIDPLTLSPLEEGKVYGFLQINDNWIFGGSYEMFQKFVREGFRGSNYEKVFIPIFNQCEEINKLNWFVW